MKTEFNTREFEFSHGRAPKGRGGWGFFPLEVSGDTSLVEGEVVFVMGSMTYTEAKKAIKAQHPEVTYWAVAP